MNTLINADFLKTVSGSFKFTQPLQTVHVMRLASYI